MPTASRDNIRLNEKYRYISLHEISNMDLKVDLKLIWIFSVQMSQILIFYVSALQCF